LPITMRFPNAIHVLYAKHWMEQGKRTVVGFKGLIEDVYFFVTTG